MPRVLVFACVLAFALSSCVAKRRYLDAQSRISRLQADSTSLADRAADLATRVSILDAANESAASKLNQSQSQVITQQQKLEQQQARLLQLQTLIEQQRAAAENLRTKIAGALTGFNANQLTVSLKNGRVYVSLAESLLFPSGSAVVNDSGKQALSTLAAALQQSPDINVEVEGHTDSIPISKKFVDNWALSTARSTEIVRLLTQQYSIAPARVTASGRSWYDPVASNETPEGRARNRRTEIILAPKLDELMRLIEEGGRAAMEDK